jgi:hypothetical protein
MISHPCLGGLWPTACPLGGLLDALGLSKLTNLSPAELSSAAGWRRDCADDIRATVIEGIGHWIRSYPSAFLSDQYLKYIAWALSDKVCAGQRCSCGSKRDQLGLAA